MENRDMAWFFEIIQQTEQAVENIKRVQADPMSQADKRSLSIALTHIETAQLWLANANPF